MLAGPKSAINFRNSLNKHEICFVSFRHPGAATSPIYRTVHRTVLPRASRWEMGPQSRLARDCDKSWYSIVLPRSWWRVEVGVPEVSARHLDMVMENRAAAETYAAAFLSGDYGFEFPRRQEVEG